MKSYFTGELVIEAQQKIYEAQHLFLFAFREFSFQGKQEGVQKEPLDPTVNLSSFGNAGIVGLGKIVIQNHYGIKEPVELNTPKGSNICINQSN